MYRKYSRTAGTGDGGVTPRGGDSSPDYSGSSPRNSTDTVHSPNNLPLESSQSDIINLLVQLLGGQNSDLASLLQRLGITTGNMNAGEIQDWNKQIMDTLLKYGITQEQRDYDKSVLQEQRLYDSPLNQLARLMGAGLSRDAALQLLGSGGSGGSGGSALIGSGENAQLPASAIPATQSDLNALQGKLGIANTVFSGISALSGLVGLGFSIPQAIQSVKALGMQNVLSQKALVGLQSADAVLSALEGAVETGVLSTKDIDGFSNATDALNYINDHKDTKAFAPLFQSGAFANVYGSKLGREMFANAWKDVRSSKDNGTILDEYIRSQKLSNSLQKVEIDKAGAELAKLGADTEAVYQNMYESLKRCAAIDADIRVKDASGKWIQVQTKWFGKRQSAEISQIEAQIENLNTQTAYNKDLYEVNHAGIPVLKQKYLDELELAAYKAHTLNSDDARKEFWQSWALEAENAHKLAYMKNCFYDATGDFATNNPNLWYLCVGLNSAHAFDAVKLGSEGAANVAVTALKYLPK